MIEPLLLCTTQVRTFAADRTLTNATAFFFERDDRTYLVTSAHVLFDRPTEHFPDRIEIELHVDEANLAHSTGFSILLYRDAKSVWRQARDDAGGIDVAVIEIQRSALPGSALFRAFTPRNLPRTFDEVEVGSSVLLVGFPLGFHDALHHTPVVRQGVIATSFGLRFMGNGYFLTDARTHRGASGAPVVMRMTDPEPECAEVPWMLLGVHSARLDVGNRDQVLDEALGLNCAWYADVLLTLTAAPDPEPEPPAAVD